jgi:hypothetical protein
VPGRDVEASKELIGMKHERKLTKLRTFDYQAMQDMGYDAKLPYVEQIGIIKKCLSEEKMLPGECWVAIPEILYCS